MEKDAGSPFEEFVENLIPTRGPNYREVEEILNLLFARIGIDEDDLAYQLEGFNLFDVSSIIVVEKFISDSPGYWGPIFYVTYTGGPEFVDVIIRNISSSMLEFQKIEV